MLSKVTAKNFQSFKNLTFTVSKGATLIDGWNEDDQTPEGAGKSAVLNAIAWCLFGKLPKDAKIDDVIKHGESSCSVVLEFTNGDTVVRTRKPNDLMINKFNGSTVKGKDAKETQEIIEEYIGCNFETFCQSTYFAQNYDKKFLSSNQEDKGKILSSIQNLQIFDKARKEVMELIKVETEKQSTLRGQIGLEQNNIRNFESQKNLIESFIRDKVEKHNNQVNLAKHRITHLKDTILLQEQKMAEVQSEIDSVNLMALDENEEQLKFLKESNQTQLFQIVHQKSQINEIKKAIALKESEGNALASKYNTLQDKKNSASDINTNPQYLRLLAERNRLAAYETTPSYVRLLGKKQEVLNFISSPTKICPSCGSQCKNLDTTHAQKELSQLDRELNEIVTANAESIQFNDLATRQFELEFKKDYENIDSEMTSVLAQLQAIGQYLDQNPVPSLENLEKAEVELKTALQNIEVASKNIQTLKNKKSQNEYNLNSMRAMVLHHHTNLRQLEESLINLGEPDVAQDYAKLAAVREELNNSNMKIAQLTLLLDQGIEHAQRLEQLKEGFKEIKSYVFTNALNELNFRTNQYLSELFEVEASIKFTNEDQKIESRIVLDGRETGLGLLSGGQNRRFNLAVDLALADIVSYRKTSKLDILILDEYFKDLSEVSMEKCLTLLKSRKCPVILIEHNSIFKNIVDNTFMVKLENGTSYAS